MAKALQTGKAIQATPFGPTELAEDAALVSMFGKENHKIGSWHQAINSVAKDEVGSHAIISYEATFKAAGHTIKAGHRANVFNTGAHNVEFMDSANQVTMPLGRHIEDIRVLKLGQMHESLIIGGTPTKTVVTKVKSKTKYKHKYKDRYKNNKDKKRK